MLVYNSLEGIWIGHGQHLGLICDLHRWRIGVTVAGDDVATQSLGGDRYLFAQFAAAEQHHCFWKGRHGGFQGSMA